MMTGDILAACGEATMGSSSVCSLRLLDGKGSRKVSSFTGSSRREMCDGTLPAG